MTPVQRPKRETAKKGEGTWEKGNYFSLYNYSINFLTLERSSLTPQTSSSLRSVSISPGRQRRTEGRSQKRDGQKGEGRKMQQVKKREKRRTSFLSSANAPGANFVFSLLLLLPLLVPAEVSARGERGDEEEGRDLWEKRSRVVTRDADSIKGRQRRKRMFFSFLTRFSSSFCAASHVVYIIAVGFFPPPSQTQKMFFSYSGQCEGCGRGGERMDESFSRFLLAPPPA